MALARQLLSCIDRQRRSSTRKVAIRSRLDQTQLLEPLQILQREGAAIRRQYIAPIPIYPHMSPVGGVAVPVERINITHVRNGTGEVERTPVMATAASSRHWGYAPHLLRAYTGVITGGSGSSRCNSATIASITVGLRNG